MPPNYDDKNVTRDELTQWDRTHLWHAFTQMKNYEPLIFHSADGVWLTDIDGNRYLDGVSSLWCNVHGHRHPKLDLAIREQLELVAHVTLLGSSNSTTVRLAKKLADLAPGDLNHVFFGSDGSSAVEAALKMAFQYWRQKNNPDNNRTRFMALQYAYHGDTIGSVSLGGVDQFHALFRPLLFDVLRLPCPDRNLFGPEQGDAEIVDHFVKLMKPTFEEHRHEIAGFIVEPLMQGAAGMIAHPVGMLKALRKLCEDYDILMIADEVAVGFGRTGSLFACQKESVIPDILCLGKGLTGGYLPLSATVARTKIWDAFLGEPNELKTLYHGHTFGGNPVASAVALANIELFESEDFFDSIKPTINRMSDRIIKMNSNAAVKSARNVGLMAGIELADNDDGLTAAEVCLRVRDYKILLRPLGNVVVVMPPLVSTPDQVDQIFDAIECVFSQ